MKTKEIYDFVKSVKEICLRKVKYAEDNKLPTDYEEGRLYETCYILENIEKIIFKDNE